MLRTECVTYTTRIQGEYKTVKARCISNSINLIADENIKRHVQKYIHLSELDLRVGNEYTMYGIFFRDGVPWYLMCEQNDDDYPTPQCSEFFVLVDGRIPDGWVFSPYSANLASPAILPATWARDGRFLEKLVDGEPISIELFRKLKATD